MPAASSPLALASTVPCDSGNLTSIGESEAGGIDPQNAPSACWGDLVAAKSIANRLAAPPGGARRMSASGTPNQRKGGVKSARAPKETTRSIRKRRRNSITMKQIRANNMGRQGQGDAVEYSLVPLV